MNKNGEFKDANLVASKRKNYLMFLQKDPGELPQDRGGRLHEVDGGQRVFGGGGSDSCVVSGRSLVLTTLQVLPLCLVLPGHLLDLQVTLHQVLYAEKAFESMSKILAKFVEIEVSLVCELCVLRSESMVLCKCVVSKNVNTFLLSFAFLTYTHSSPLAV